MGRRSGAAPRTVRPRAAALGARDAAWIAVVPSALALVALIALAGPWLGRTFMGPAGDAFWPSIAWTVRPEPEEHGRYAIALLGPVLAVGGMVALLRHGLPRVGRARADLLARVSELLVLAFVVVCAVAQHAYRYGAGDPDAEPFTRVYFTLATLVAGLALALATAAVLRRPRAAARAWRLLRESRGRALAAVAVAIAATATWLTTAIVLDSSAQSTTWAVVGNIVWSMNETYAVLNGTGPLTGFTSQYGQLWPYLVAVPMTLLGPSLGVYTITMACIDAAALLAVFAVLRRIARSSLAALLLYLPFLATGFFMKLGPLDDRYAPSNLFSLWPVRYAGPYLLAWLVARHVDGVAPRRRVALFVCAGLVAINNPEFGVAAFAATLVALATVRPSRSWRPLASLAGGAALGLLGAAALVAALTLAVVGELPRFPQLLYFSRLYGIEGWVMEPMPTLGTHLVAYVTFAAAIVVAAARVAGGRASGTLTAMLAWSGTFGLLAGGYYVGHSHPEVLIDVFSAWALAVALLVVVVVRAVAARPSRLPRPAELAVLVAFGVAACSLAQTPTPWSQVDRIRREGDEPILEQRDAVRFVADATAPGERVAILFPLSHRVAYDAGVVNVAPYSSVESMPTRDQLRRTIAALRGAGGRRLFLPDGGTQADMAAALSRAGFEEVRRDPSYGYGEWADRGR